MTYQEYKEKIAEKVREGIKVKENSDGFGSSAYISNEIPDEILSIEIAPNFTLKELIEKATVECPNQKCGGLGFIESIDDTCPDCDGKGSIIQPEGLVRLSDNQELPENKFDHMKEESILAWDLVNDTQQDMLKDNWRKIDER